MIRLKILIVFSVVLQTACSSTYIHNEIRPIYTSFAPSKGVLISVPMNGKFIGRVYPSSGKMTANAIKTAFDQFSNNVHITTTCHGDDCLNSIELNKYGYYVMPEILHWEDRATEWSGLRDRIEIKIIIFDAQSKQQVANSSYKGISKWGTFGGDHPQDLLEEPTNQYINSLYQYD